MSLHAALNPDALRLLHNQKRNSTISSLLISVLSIILAGLCLAFFLLPAIEHVNEGAQCYYPGDQTDKPKPPHTPTRSFVQHLPSPPSHAAPSITALTTSRIALPQNDSLSEIIGLSAGDSDGTGENGIDSGDGHFSPIHAEIEHRQRCSQQDRMARLKQYGGKPETEEAVVNALRWMKQNQAPDGSWGDSHKTGMTGLALLAYLGHCEDPSSEEFGDSCLKGIVYLLNIGSKNEGRLTTNTQDKHWPYQQAIATYALAEAYSFSKGSGYTIPQHREVLQQAGQWIIDHQHTSGGWDYAYDMTGTRGGDLSIVAWQVQALKACKVSGLEFSKMKKSIQSALSYISQRQAANGGFGYTGTSAVGSASHHSLTGAGMLAYQMWGKGSRSEVRKGARYILANAKLDYNGPECDLYAHYYHSQAMMQRRGEQWQKYNDMFRDQILLNQDENGAWKKPGGGNKPNAAGALYANDTQEGILYRTCLCTLMLEVYYVTGHRI